MGKSLSFANNEAFCVYHDGAVMDVADVVASDIWYQCNEMQQIKRRALLLTRESNRYSVGATLTNTYGRNDKETIDSIAAWCIGSSSRRGLERFLNKDYSCRRSEIRRRVVTSVLRAQGKMREEGIDDPEYISRVLSRLSETFSKDARLFAEALGNGDEAASGRELADPMDIDLEPKKLERINSPKSVLDMFPVHTMSEQQGLSLRPTMPRSTISPRLGLSVTTGATDYLGWRSFA